MCGIVLLLAAYVTVTCVRIAAAARKYGAIEWVRAHASGGWVLRVGKMWTRRDHGSTATRHFLSLLCSCASVMLSGQCRWVVCAFT